MTTYYDEGCRPVASLEKGLNIHELLKSDGTEFEFTAEDDDEETLSPDVDFNFEQAQQKLANLDLIDVEESEDGVDCTPFDKFRRKMTDVDEDGKLKKFIVRQGTGDFVPDNSVVYVNYQAYFEYEEIPFDSTFLQNLEKSHTVRYNLSKRNIINGLHMAILTMRKGEKAEFLIHPDLAYGKLGCPPRIPADATALFFVEVENFVDCAQAFDENNEDDIAPEERNKFINVNKKAKDLNKLANDLFKNQNYSQAVNKYKIIGNMLHNARLADEEEEKARNKFLLKVYSNSCICYDKLKLYKKVCISVNDAMKVDPRAVRNHCKLLYFWGKAKMFLGDYQAARKHLMDAQRLDPRDKTISDTFLALSRREKSATAQERIMWQKACGSLQPSSVKVRELTKEEEAFRDLIQQQLTEFKASEEREWTLTQHFTSEEEKTVIQLAKDLQLYARVADGEKRVITIKKPNAY